MAGETYEYRIVSLTAADGPETLNRLGGEGWRVVPGSVHEYVSMRALMERIIAAPRPPFQP